MMSLNLEKAKELIDIKLMKTNNLSEKTNPPHHPPPKKNNKKTPKNKKQNNKTIQTHKINETKSRIIKRA